METNAIFIHHRRKMYVQLRLGRAHPRGSLRNAVELLRRSRAARPCSSSLLHCQKLLKRWRDMLTSSHVLARP